MANTRSLTYKRVTNAVGLRESIVLANDPALAAIVHSLDAGQSWDMDGTTGPVVTGWWHGLVTLVAGALTIDLTNLTDPATGLTVTMNTLKLRVLHLTAPSGNAGAITIAPGASNGFTGWTVTGEVLSASDQRGPNIFYGGIAVDATHKTIDLSGTGTDSVRMVMLFGA